MLRFATIFFLALSSLPADDLAQLGAEYWKWRAANQPVSHDDIPRIERPAGFLPDWSQAAVTRRLREAAGFRARWEKLADRSKPVSWQVDYRLIGSALERVRWELEVERSWQRNSNFYIVQSLGSVFEALLLPPPFTASRTADLIARTRRIPKTLAEAQENLTDARRPFALLAADELKTAGDQLLRSVELLKPHLQPEAHAQLTAAAKPAAAALNQFRDWNRQNAPKMPESTAVGREKYVYFLRNVALLPFTPEELLLMGAREWERSASFETYEMNRNRALPQLALFPNQAAQIQREAADEQAIRVFLEKQNLLTVPVWMQHYINLPLPDYLAALPGLAVTDDLTGPARLKENGVSYIRQPSLKLGYFGVSTARDPRPIVVHEGVPGHYFQLCLSWAHENPLRRFYYDSGPNEGIGFYAEEMMLQAGLFDNIPRTREIIYNFARLRALRVEVDVKLALGQFTIEQAADYLTRTVPMDRGTALNEAVNFAADAGQAISYQIGKIQILQMLADARRAQGSQFSLRKFHDFVWKNGNVPFSLQRWELLADSAAVPAAVSAPVSAGKR